MIKGIDTTKIKALLKDRRVLWGIAAACALAAVLIVILFSRYVADCVSVGNAYSVKNTNKVTYEVNVKQ